MPRSNRKRSGFMLPRRNIPKSKSPKWCLFIALFDGGEIREDCDFSKDWYFGAFHSGPAKDKAMTKLQSFVSRIDYANHGRIERRVANLELRKYLEHLASQSEYRCVQRLRIQALLTNGSDLAPKFVLTEPHTHYMDLVRARRPSRVFVEYTASNGFRADSPNPYCRQTALFFQNYLGNREGGRNGGNGH
jgi:hypothetical protein